MAELKTYVNVYIYDLGKLRQVVTRETAIDLICDEVRSWADEKADDSVEDICREVRSWR